MRTRRIVAAAAAVVMVAGMIGFTLGANAGGRTSAGTSTSLPGFSKIVFLSHVNDPRKTPVFPGDPAFKMSTAFTVPQDGYYLQYVKEGEHTGTHYSAPCHFHTQALCADQLSPGDFVLPAVVVDVRAEVKANVDYEVSVADLKAWEAAHGQIPAGAAVLLWTGCDRYWSPDFGAHIPTYYNCGSADGKFRQPGFSKASVRWLIKTGVLAGRGALGTDTFGPDPGSDLRFMETWLTLRRHRFTLENLTHLGSMPVTGGWIVIGGPRNRHGSGAPSTVFGLIP